MTARPSCRVTRSDSVSRESGGVGGRSVIVGRRMGGRSFCADWATVHSVGTDGAGLRWAVAAAFLSREDWKKWANFMFGDEAG